MAFIATTGFILFDTGYHFRIDIEMFVGQFFESDLCLKSSFTQQKEEHTNVFTEFCKLLASRKCNSYGIIKYIRITDAVVFFYIFKWKHSKICSLQYFLFFRKLELVIA